MILCYLSDTYSSGPSQALLLLLGLTLPLLPLLPHLSLLPLLSLLPPRSTPAPTAAERNVVEQIGMLAEQPPPQYRRAPAAPAGLQQRQSLASAASLYVVCKGPPPYPPTAKI